MKYSSKLGLGDIDYINIKKTISECTAAEFIDQICKSANFIKIEPESVQRNFLGCLKLFKKFEKQRRQLIPRSLIHSIYEVPAFKIHENKLRDIYERKYPQFAKACQVLIIGHRAFEPYPASKLNGFSLRYRPDYVEVDVCQCRSGQVLLQHDRFSSDGRPIEECTFNGLSGAIELKDLLRQLHNQNAPQLMIDLKGSTSSADLVIAIKQDLESTDFPLDAILMASFNMHHLLYLTELLPQVRRALLTSNIALDDYISFLQQANCDLIIIDENTISREMVQAYRKHGIDVWCFTVNSMGRLSAIADMGVSGLITDFPNMLL